MDGWSHVLPSVSSPYHCPPIPGNPLSVIHRSPSSPFPSPLLISPPRQPASPTLYPLPATLPLPRPLPSPHHLSLSPPSPCRPRSDGQTSSDLFPVRNCLPAWLSLHFIDSCYSDAHILHFQRWFFPFSWLNVVDAPRFLDLQRFWSIREIQGWVCSSAHSPRAGLEEGRGKKRGKRDSKLMLCQNWSPSFVVGWFIFERAPAGECDD